MKKDRFSNDFKAARLQTGMSLEECGRSLGLTGSAVGNWENPGHKSFPRYERWERIKDLLGVNPQDYVVEVRDISVSGNRSAGSIVASNGASVTVGETNRTCDSCGDGVIVELTPIEHQVLTKFRKFGNSEMLKICIRKLEAIEAMVA